MPTAQSGMVYILNNALTNKVLYALLTNTLLSIDSTLADAAAEEVIGGGYVRLPIGFNTATIDSQGFATTVSSSIQFNATGANIGPFQAIAIVDVASGTSGSIISFFNYSVPTTVENGAGLAIEYPIQIQSENV
jgi:hypothetical protein